MEEQTNISNKTSSDGKDKHYNTRLDRNIHVVLLVQSINLMTSWFEMEILNASSGKASRKFA